MQALLLLSSLTFHFTQASQSQIEGWTPSSHFYTSEDSRLTYYTSRVIGSLFCNTSRSKGVEWLESMCRSITNPDHLGDLYEIYIGYDHMRNPKSLSDTVKSLVQFDSILHGTLKIKEKLEAWCMEYKSKNYCTDGKIKKEISEMHEKHVADLVNNFKWNDFLPKEMRAVEIAEKIVFDGTDWAPLLKFVQLTPNQLYSLDRKLKTDEKLRQELQDLVAPFAKELRKIESESLADQVSGVKRADELMAKFEEQVKMKLVALPKINAFGQELFDDVMPTIQTLKGTSKFYTAKNYDLYILISKVLYDKDDIMYDDFREVYYQIHRNCKQISPFPNASMGTELNNDRVDLWNRLQIVWKILSGSTAEELAERVLFSIRNGGSYCPKIQGDQYIKNLLTGNQHELKTELSENFEKVKAKYASGPWTITPETFLPKQTDRVDEHYSVLSKGYDDDHTLFRKMFPDSEWTIFMESVRANGPCMQVATKTDEELKDLLETLKWDSMSSLTNNDCLLEKFENHKECIKMVKADKKSDKKDVGAEKVEPLSRAVKQAVHVTHNRPITKSKRSLFNTVNWLKAAVITVILGLVLLFVAAAVQYNHSQQQHLLVD